MEPEKKDLVKRLKYLSKNDLVRMLATIGTIVPVAPTEDEDDKDVDPVQAFIAGEYHVLQHIHDIIELWLNKDTSPARKQKKS